MAQGQKHTPGPWVVDSGNGSACYIRPADHEPGVMAVAQVCKRGWSEKQAIARLIAAAPDMLAALVELREYLLDGDGTDPVLTHRLAVVKAAIQKATGGAK